MSYQRKYDPPPKGGEPARSDWSRDYSSRNSPSSNTDPWNKGRYDPWNDGRYDDKGGGSNKKRKKRDNDGDKGDDNKKRKRKRKDWDKDWDKAKKDAKKAAEDAKKAAKAAKHPKKTSENFVKRELTKLYKKIIRHPIEHVTKATLKEIRHSVRHTSHVIGREIIKESKHLAPKTTKALLKEWDKAKPYTRPIGKDILKENRMIQRKAGKWTGKALEGAAAFLVATASKGIVNAADKGLSRYKRYRDLKELHDYISNTVERWTTEVAEKAWSRVPPRLKTLWRGVEEEAEEWAPWAEDSSEWVPYAEEAAEAAAALGGL